uniref:Putative secreted protein n=1 Tax=Anopheles darlingi TaxID=43151 RepID=A0A2M4DJX4_ANODA
MYIVITFLMVPFLYDLLFLELNYPLLLDSCYACPTENRSSETICDHDDGFYDVSWSLASYYGAIECELADLYPLGGLGISN